MAQGFYGADPDQLRALAKQFSSGSNQIRSSLDTVSSLVNSTQSWHGPDASAFQQRWNSQVKQLGNTVVHALEQGSTTLIKNADEQTATSQVDGGAAGGSGSSGGGGGSGSSGGHDQTGDEPKTPISKDSPFRDAWGKWGEMKNAIGLPKNALGLSLMLAQGKDAFYDAAKWGDLAKNNWLYKAFDDTGNLVGLKDLNKYIPGLKGAAAFFEDAPTYFKGMGDNLEALGKTGFGRTLGWAGVGLSLFDAVEQANAGKPWESAASVGKAALGVACFLPPPVGTVAQVGSAVIAIYEIPAVKTFVDDTAKAVADTVVSAVKDPGKFATDVGKNIADMGEGVKDFFGW